MSKRVSLEVFAALAMNEYSRLDLHRNEIKSLKDIYGVSIPSVIWKNKSLSKAHFIICAEPDYVSASDVSSVPIKVKSAPVAKSAPVSAALSPEVDTPSGVMIASHRPVGEYVPKKDPSFVPWGNFGEIKTIIKSGVFLPTYIQGETGNGKTFSVKQAAADLGREFIRVNFTAETDEDDLIGGFRLIGGDTVWVDGPVIEAMVRGAILLLDEIDLASSKVMALQSILEGDSYFIKKINRLIEPAPGFSVMATANTKGDGMSDDYSNTQILNKAFLDRFPVMIEQSYPGKVVETKILKKAIAVEKGGKPSEDDLDFVEKLVKFSDIIRASFNDGAAGVEDVISTRRLVDIIKLYFVFGNRDKAVKLATNRFSDEVRDQFYTLWMNIDENAEEVTDPKDGLDEIEQAIPF